VKLAITHPYSWPEVRRGAERILVETARALAARGHEVTVFTAGAKGGRLDADGFKTVRLRRRFADPNRHERWFGWRMHWYLATGGFDAVHSLFPYDAAAAIHTKRLGGHRAVYEELGIPSSEYWAGRPDEGARKRVCRSADVYGCMSRFALDAFEHEWHRRGALIPGGVRLDQFTPAPRREPRPTLLFSGALDEPRKGAATLVESLAIVAKAEPKVRLWLSGPGDAGPLLEAATAGVRKRVEVLPLGKPNEQAERYGRAWATVLPSMFESFGMVLVESLACGTPIVVANHSAPPELVGPGIGAVCEPEDPVSLASSILEALTQARDPATVDRCRAAASAFDWESALAPRLETLYRGDRDPDGPTGVEGVHPENSKV
jgi:glycosyltransferase involved in cell wall biosynthesis